MTPQEFIQLINGDLALEYAAAIQYRQHAVMLNNTYASFVAELYDHAEDEWRHAKQLAELITWLGGTPSIEVAPRFVSSDNLAMLQQDLDGEETAITRYEERVKQAGESGFFIARHVLESILSKEAGHRTDIKNILGRI